MIHSLNLNKHPKDCKNLSLINAVNVKVSDDGSCLQSENEIIINNTIKETLDGFYNEPYKIISFIPCNTELVIFTARKRDIGSVNIFRYNERVDKCKLNYSGLLYYQGEINGDFTYNVNDELIISFCEYGAIQDVPLKTLNLGKFDETIEYINDKHISINPEVKIPTLINYDYVTGVSKRGWYYIFVRYKIDKNDYTKWFDIGGPILIETIEKQSIFKLYGYKKENSTYIPFTTGAVDHFALDEDIANETINLDFKYLDRSFKQYQIGFICVNKDSTIAYHSLDLDINVNKYTLKYELMEECDYGELIIDNANFYNVRNIINYKNRLYISNYKEKDLTNYDTSNIKLSLNTKRNEYYDLKSAKYEMIEEGGNGYNVLDKDIEYNEKFEEDSAKAILELPLKVDGVIYNDLFTTSKKTLNLSEIFTGETCDSPYRLEYYDNLSLKDGVERFVEYDGNYISGVTLKVNRLFKIKTSKGNLLNVQFYSEIRQPIRNGDIINDTKFIYVINNKRYEAKCAICHTAWNSFLAKDASIKFKIKETTITDDVLVQQIDSTSNKYINTKNTFNERKKQSTLIPGEIYNFYIHFVDKYGFNTRGFKLNPKHKYFNQYSDYTGTKNVVPVLYDYHLDHKNNYYKYVLVNANTRIFNDSGKVELRVQDCQKLCNEFGYVTFKDEFIAGYGQCVINTEQIEKRLQELYGGLSDIKDIVWEDVMASDMQVYIINNVTELNNFNFGEFTGLNKLYKSDFIPYRNANGEMLFKIPYNTIDFIKGNNKAGYVFTNYELQVDNVDLPEGYIGYFISAEKVEETTKATGIVCANDYNVSDYNENDQLTFYNKGKSDKVYFYCSDFDIADNFELKFNAIRFENRTPFNNTKSSHIINNSIIENPINLNNPQIYDYLSDLDDFDVRYFPLKDYKILVAGDAVKGRFGLGTCLEIPFDGWEDTGNYKASLLYIDTNKYISKDKQLIRITNTIYPNEYEEFAPIQYLPGHNSYDGFIMYDRNRFVYNEIETRVYAEKNKKYIGYGATEHPNAEDPLNLNAKLLSYIQAPVYKNFFCESKSFKNNPQQVNFLLEEVDAETKEVTAIATQLGVIVIPINTIDLFENKLSYPQELTPKPFTNNRPEITYITQFDKFVRRSDIIQDESLSNSWRRFGLENYKVISENKGKITNLIGLGHYLLVHTEHSIFMFDASNTLKTVDQNIQLMMPDVFDIDYKELITSDLGYAGLQDKYACIVDQFGYIFYDNDEHRIYRFDSGQLNYIDGNIVQYLKKYKPDTIRFAHDKDSNRILLNITHKDINHDINKTLSYHYVLNEFISFHDYYFDKAVNTKNKLYLYTEKEETLYNFNYDNITNTGYNKYAMLSTEHLKSKIDIIINDSYNNIKMLEYILYKLYKINITETDYEASPVEGMRIPYSGEQIRVYNNEVDTGYLDITINPEPIKGSFRDYKKPYWELGNWNFSYLRNKLSDKLGSNFMSRIYGNYFIISIIFGSTNERFEFESLGYNITKDKKI